MGGGGGGVGAEISWALQKRDFKVPFEEVTPGSFY